MVLGIISNTAAATVAYNLEQASASSQSSMQRLSDGKEIVQASDDVAGLAVGTILATNVSTLKSAMTNTAQAQSMLGVADGALANIGNILQRQKALSTEATSGALGAQALSFLNAEFQSLMAEIDQIAGGTQFNGINILDGSLFAPASIQTNTNANATQAKGRINVNTALAPAAGNNALFVYINGSAIAFAAQNDIGSSKGTTGDLAQITVNTTVNTTAAEQAQALYNAINTALNYSGTDKNVLAVKESLAKMSYGYTAGNAYVDVTANVAGTVGNGETANSATGTGAFSVGAGNTYTDGTVTVSKISANAIQINGGDATGAAGANAITANSGALVGLGWSGSYAGQTYTALNAAVDGDLSGGTFPTAGTAYNATAGTIAQGTVGDSILKPLTTTVQGTTGVDVSLISNNPSFVGTISGFQVKASGEPNIVSMSLTVGNFTYTATGVNTLFNTQGGANGTQVTFSSSGGGGSFTLLFAKNDITIASQSDADGVASRLNAAFNGLNFYQDRKVGNFKAAGLILDANNNTVGDLAGSSVKFLNSNFNGATVANISVQAPAAGAANAVITITTNTGEVYTSGYTSAGAAQALGTSLAAGSYGLVSQTNPNNMFVFNYASSTNLNLSTTTGATAAQAALQAAFGVNTGATSVQFQVGLTAADSISVSLPSAKSSVLYNNATLNLSNLGNAIAAGSVLDTALNTLISIRANVGALESRFNFAASNLNSAIQNQDSARAIFLDTDIPTESTKFAQAQVMVQASVSVLAQANQLSQTLLKLIG